jgi:outer membrane protein, heavy metal efflux system
VTSLCTHLRARSVVSTTLLAVLWVTAGCARFHPEPISPAESADRLESRSLTNLDVRAFLEQQLKHPLAEWPPARWDFETLTLAAWYYHPSLEVARAQRDTARAGETTAAQHPNPVLTVTPGYDTTTAIPSPWIPLTSLDVPIETAGKRGYRRDHAARLSEAARLNIAAVAWQIRGQVRQALLNLTSARRRTELLEKQLDLQNRTLDLTEQQASAGAVARSATTALRVQLAKTRLDLADARRLGLDAQAQLAESIGVPLAAVQALPVEAGWPPSRARPGELTSAAVRRLALQSRPDILGALAEYAASQSALQLEIARQYPDVHLQPGYQYDQGDNKWALGLVVELPVLHQNQGAIAEAAGRRREAAARFLALQAKVMAEIERAVQNYQASVQALADFQALQDQQARRRDQINAQYRAGAAEQLDLLNAQTEFAATEMLQLEGRLRHEQAFAALEDAVQRPFELPPTVFESRPTTPASRSSP